MVKKLKRNIQQLFRIDDNELDLIKKKMDKAGIINKEAYYRKMVIDGFIVRLDLSEVREMNRLLSNATNNLNQIARRVNTSGSLLRSDIENIQNNYEQLWNQQNKILRDLAKIRSLCFYKI